MDKVLYKIRGFTVVKYSNGHAVSCELSLESFVQPWGYTHLLEKCAEKTIERWANNRTGAYI